VTSPDPRWRDDWALGDDFVPAGRYTSPEFFALEMERLWPRVWQIAGRQDELRETGDFVEYRIGTQSILVVRTPAGALKAYHNACRHRGRRLASGCGRFEGRTIRCPFHGWAWNLEGENVHVFHGEEFDAGTISRERLQLVECQLDTWGGFVWINMDPSAPPLRQAIGPATRQTSRSSSITSTAAGTPTTRFRCPPVGPRRSVPTATRASSSIATSPTRSTRSERCTPRRIAS
jgi:phenylpropionate dioxygenase-like ring-hydroxylating dioxygenase large terminal subunit